MKNEEYYLNGYKLRSFLEYYFGLWLNELQEQNFINKWTYEDVTFPLFEGLKLPYKKRLKYKIKDEIEHIFDVASFTEDFCIHWNLSAENLFYLNPEVPIRGNVSAIPFRLGNGKDLVSYIDVKSTNASTTSSSVSYPYKAKWTYQMHGILIHKIYPLSLSKTDCKKTLFFNTFFPKSVKDILVYEKNCKWGNIGESRIKYPARTLQEYLKYRGYEIK